MARVTGIGGIFFKSRGKAEQLSSWYQEHLGIKLEEWGGGILNWQEDKADDKGLTVWSVADSDSTWFEPGEASFMVNYRVDNLEELLQQLASAGIKPIQGPEAHENGSFAWILDPDNNKVELWEPRLWSDQ